MRRIWSNTGAQECTIEDDQEFTEGWNCWILWWITILNLFCFQERSTICRRNLQTWRSPPCKPNRKARVAFVSTEHSQCCIIARCFCSPAILLLPASSLLLETQEPTTHRNYEKCIGVHRTLKIDEFSIDFLTLAFSMEVPQTWDEPLW